MENNTQLLKGVLEYCVLKLISREPTYGYEIVMNLKRFERKHALSTALAFGTEGKGHGRASAFSQGTQSEILCGHRERQGSIADLSTGLETALQAGRKNF